MSSDDIKVLLKDKLSRYLDETRGTQIGGASEKQIPCPNSAAHVHGDKNPSARYYGKPGDQHVHCHGCGGHWDIFDLVALDQGYSLPAQFTEVVDFLKVRYGITSTAKHNTQHSAIATATKCSDVASYLRFCVAHFSGCDYLRKRGISDETARKFGIGYDPAERRVVFPQGAGYVARAIDDPLPANVLRYRYPKGCEVSPFNLSALWNAEKRPVFIVEGQIDALSIFEGGGLAVGLGGITHGRGLLDAIKTRPITVPLIVSFDNDGKQQTMAKQKELVDALQGLGVNTYTTKFYPDGCKDANEFLLADAIGFASAIATAEKEALAEAAAKLPDRFTMDDLPDELIPESQNPNALFKNGYLRKGHGMLIVSTSGAGKSVFSNELAAFAAAGEPFFGIAPVRPLRVCVIQAEDDRDELILFKRNLRTGLTTQCNWSDEKIRRAMRNVTYERVIGKTGRAFLDRLQEIQRKQRYDLIIVNPLFSYFGGDLSNNKDDSEFFREGLDPIIKNPVNGFGIIFIHHANKPPKGQDRKGWGTDVFAQYIGAGGTDVAGWTRAQLVLMPIDGHYGWFSLIAAKRGGALGWRDGSGEKTTQRIIAYSPDIIFWRSPSPDEIPTDIKASAAKSATGSDISQGEAEQKIVAKIFSCSHETGISKTDLWNWCVDAFTGIKNAKPKPCKLAYDNVTSNPAEFGVETYFKDRKKWYRRAQPTLNDAAQSADVESADDLGDLL